MRLEIEMKSAIVRDVGVFETSYYTPAALFRNGRFEFTRDVLQADRRVAPPGGVRGVRELPEGDHLHEQIRRQGRPRLRQVRGFHGDVEGPVQHVAGENADGITRRAVCACLLLSNWFSRVLGWCFCGL